MDCTVEQGPIRPPSEAMSILVRVSRNCPWNRCAFCPVYKGERYSRREVSEVLADLDSLARLHGDGVRTVFLQDADPLLSPPGDLVRILEGIRERFPGVRRITAYARSRTLVRRSLADLERLKAAGLTRIHVGLESGSDEVLALVEKGVTRAGHVEGGRKAKAAGFELSEYVMPGLGGRRLSRAHADGTAAALAAIAPDFVRLRTTAFVPGAPLADLVAEGRLEPLTEEETMREIRRFLAGLRGVATRIESDHLLNLLLELRGDLPGDLDRLLGICDRFLSLPSEDRTLFILGRRTGAIRFLRQLDRPRMRERLSALCREAEERGLDPRALAEALRGRLV